MFYLERYQHEYHYSMHTLLYNILPSDLVQILSQRILDIISEQKVQLVNHQGIGTLKELDGAGKYLHYIFRGADVRNFLPELVGLYHGLLPIVSTITNSAAIISPYPNSDINIKVYPPKGGTIGWHYDTNAITVLIYLTNNSEAPLVLKIEKSHPSKKKPKVNQAKIFAKNGMMLLMQGRNVWHRSEPTNNETKIVAVLNYYVEGDTWRPSNFDKFVYDGVPQEHA